MSLKPRTFPYPVLSPSSDDFLGATFDADLDFKPTKEEGGTSFTLDFAIQLNSEFLSTQVQEGLAELWLDVESPETLHRQAYPIQSSGSLQFAKGALFGKVTLTPYLLASVPQTKYTPRGVHHEYSGAEFSVRPGDVLAYGPSQDFEFIRDETSDPDFITFVLAPEMDPDVYQVDVMGSPILVRAGSNVMTYWSKAREDAFTKPALYQGVYKDCVLFALSALAANEVGEDVYWAKALLSKVQDLGISEVSGLDSQELNEVAQRLLARDGLKKALKQLED